MAKPKCFVHKQTVESLQNKKAIIPGTDLAYVDLAFYFDTPTMHKLVKFYSENSPLQCEVDAYGDFLQALGPGATAKYCWETSSGKLARQQAVLREKLFNVLKETPLRVVIFHEAQFNHLGTIAEYLYHLCDNCILRRAYNFNIKSVDEERREGYGSCKVKTAEISSSEGYVLMQSVVHDTQSLSVGVKTVIEYCILERGVSIGRKCLLSNLHVPENSVIPENTFIHTVAVEIDHTIAYATCVFDVHDVVKKTSPKSSALELHFLHVPLGSALNMESAMNMLWPQNDECNLWTAKLFPVCSSRKESCAAAIKIISGVQRKCLQDVLGQYSQLVSMEDLLILKSGTSMLAFHEELRSSSIN